MNIKLTGKITKLEGLTDGATYFIQIVHRNNFCHLVSCKAQLIQSTTQPDESTIGLLNDWFKITKKQGVDVFIKLENVDNVNNITVNNTTVVVEEC